MPKTKVVLTQETMAWFEALASNGAFTVDVQGKAELSPDVRAVVQMLHEIVAGGAVQMTVTTPGDAALRAVLEKKLQAAMTSVNLRADGDGPWDPYGP